MSKEIITQNENITADSMLSLLGGDLAKLTPQQRVEVYKMKCEEIGISFLDSPFLFATLNGKTTFVATKKVANHLVAKYKPKKLRCSKPEIVTIKGSDFWIIEAVLVTNDGRELNKWIQFPVTGTAPLQICNDHLKAETKVTSRVVGLAYGNGIYTADEMQEVGARIFKMNDDGNLYEVGKKPINIEGKATVIEKPAVDPRKLQLIADVKEYAKAMGWEATTLTDFWGTMRNLDNIEAQLAYFEEVKTAAGGEIELVKTEDVTVNDLPFDTDI